jgi:hypothetical protein
VPDPDTKDWTWVISESCPDCGFAPTEMTREEVPELVHHYTDALRTELDRQDAAVRPSPTTWSPLEYGCHVRDVCALARYRLRLMLTEDDPVFPNWDQDDTALEQRYWEQERAAVADQLAEQAGRLADDFAAVSGAQWDRPGRRSNGSLFTVDTFARYILHDLAHHSWDVTGEPVR